MTARRILATAVATADAISQPIMIMTAKPMIFGIAPSNIARAAASDVIMASVQLVTGAMGMIQLILLRWIN